ncbi:hypothetical protein ASPBRDRAFT_44394, partial [Aspergillus brasiliensis CBS 101740]
MDFRESRVRVPGSYICKVDSSSQETTICREDIPPGFQVFKSDRGSESYDRRHLSYSQI